MSTSSDKSQKITAEQVRAFLKENPDFLKTNADVIETMTPPEQKLGGGIIDFQHYLVKNLQKGSQDLQSRYDVLVEFCRDNMSVQSQVHQAALRLIRTKSLEQLLEVIAIDLTSLFDVDVVRLAIESELGDMGEADFGGQHSGIVLVSPGTGKAALGNKKNVLLIEDTAVFKPPGFDDIFADCADMVESCAFLKLQLEKMESSVILAFGVRYKKRFHPGQGIELLNFLGQIVAHRLDMYLDDLTM